MQGNSKQLRLVPCIHHYWRKGAMTDLALADQQGGDTVMAAPASQTNRPASQSRRSQTYLGSASLTAPVRMLRSRGRVDDTRGWRTSSITRRDTFAAAGRRAASTFTPRETVMKRGHVQGDGTRMFRSFRRLQSVPARSPRVQTAS